MKEYSGTHKASVFAALNSDRSAEDSYCDIILEVDGRKFPVHKCILGKISTFFNRMFKTEMKEKYVGTVQIHGITSTLMENILEYIYTESINIEEESAVELLKAADYLQLDELKSLCTFFFSELINITNCFDLLELGITFDCSLLCEEAEVVIASKFEKFAKEDDYLKILPRCFLNILKHVDQKNYISTKLYEAATKWIKWDQENRSKYFVDCLKIINFKYLSTAFIQDVLDNEVLIKDSHTCKDYILQMLLNRLKLSSTESNEDNAAGKAASPDETSGGSHGGSQQNQHLVNVRKKVQIHSETTSQSLKKVLQETELNRAEYPWKPSRFYSKQTTATMSEEEQIEKILRQVRSILNKLTPQNFYPLMQKFQQLPINSEIRLREVINLIYEKAIDESIYCETYANMCRTMSQFRITTPSAQGSAASGTVEFRKILLTRCQREFERDRASENTLSDLHKKVEEAKNELEKLQYHKHLEYAETKQRCRMLGNIRFIGELFKLQMLTKSVMHNCVMSLFRARDEEGLECLCILLSTIGKSLDHPKTKKRMDQYFNQIVKIIRERKTSLRVRFKLMDVVDLRQNAWVPRVFILTPKTIDQIHADAKRERERESNN